jgi:hypothetical protein
MWALILEGLAIGGLLGLTGAGGGILAVPALMASQGGRWHRLRLWACLQSLCLPWSERSRVYSSVLYVIALRSGLL